MCANLSKCEVYITGLDETLEGEISSTLGIPLGAFPFKYLGLPLSNKKLSISQCMTLVQNITMRIRVL